MKHNPKEQQLSMTELRSPVVKDNTLNFVKFVFPWGLQDTPLEDFKGPRKWQEKILREMTIHIQRNGVKDLP